MNKRLMFSAALVMALLSANAQKRAFTIEDLYRVKGVSSGAFRLMVRRFAIPPVLLT